MPALDHAPSTENIQSVKKKIGSTNRYTHDPYSYLRSRPASTVNQQPSTGTFESCGREDTPIQRIDNESPIIEQPVQPKTAIKKYTHDPYPSLRKKKAALIENQPLPTETQASRGMVENSDQGIDDEIQQQVEKEPFIIPDANYVITGVTLMREENEVSYYLLSLLSRENPRIKGARYYVSPSVYLTDLSGTNPLGERSPLRRDGVLTRLLRHFGFEANAAQVSYQQEPMTCSRN